MQIPERLVQPGGVGVPQREGRAEVRERLAVGVQRPGVFAGLFKVVRRLLVPAGQPVVVRDLGASATRRCMSRLLARLVSS